MLVCQSVQVTSHKGQELYNNKNCQNCHLNSDQKQIWSPKTYHLPFTMLTWNFQVSWKFKKKRINTAEKKTKTKKHVSQEDKTGSITFHEILVV